VETLKTNIEESPRADPCISNVSTKGIFSMHRRRSAVVQGYKLVGAVCIHASDRNLQQTRAAMYSTPQ